MVRAWIAATCVLVAACGNKQVTQERATDSSTDGEVSTSTNDPSSNESPSSNDDDNDSTGSPMTSTSSPTDPSMTSNAVDTDTDTDPGTGTTFSATDFTSGFTTTGGDAFWCADHDLGEMAVPVSYSDSNDGRTDANLGSCTDGVGGDEFLVVWTAPAGDTYYIDTIGSSIDTVLYVLDACNGTELACNDDYSTEVVTSSLSVDLFAGESILIVIDGYNAQASGSFELYISN